MSKKKKHIDLFDFTTLHMHKKPINILLVQHRGRGKRILRTKFKNCVFTAHERIEDVKAKVKGGRQ